MTSRLFYILITITCSCLTLASQNVIRGYVKDSLTSQPIAFANIIVTSVIDSNIIAFDVSDVTGTFEVTWNNDKEPMCLKISLLGYNEKVIQVDNSSTSELTVLLSPQSEALQEIVIKAYKRGIIINGDTTTYDKSVFSSGHEENVSDILSKLPGIQVDQDGAILANGNEVKEILINGDDFLSENRNAILKGLSPSDVSNISIYENYRGEFHEEKTTALNIELNDDNTYKFRGKVEASLGINRKYHGKANPYLINKKQKIYFNIKSANTGKYKLGISDYLFLNGGSLDAGQIIPQVFNDFNNYKALQSNYASMNFSFKPNNFVKYKGFIFYNNNEISTSGSSERISENMNFNLFSTSSSISQSPFYGGFVNLTIDPNEKTQVVIKMRASQEKQDGLTIDSTLINKFPQNTSYGDNQKRRKINTDVDFHHLISEESRADMTLNYTYNRNNQSLGINSESTVLPIVIQYFNDDALGVKQELSTATHKISLGTNYSKWHNNWEYNVGVKHQFDQNNIELNRLATVNTYHNQSNNLSKTSLDQKFNLSFARSNLTVGMPIEHYQVSFGEKQENQYFIAGFLSLEQELSSISTISLTYNKNFTTTNLTAPNDLAVLSSPTFLAISRYDPLRILSSHMGKINLKYQNPETGLFVNTHVRYALNESSKVEYNYDESYSIFIADQFAFREAIELGLFFSKKINRLPVGFRGYAYYRKYINPRIFAEQEYEETNSSLYSEVVAYTSSKKILNAEITLKINTNTFNALSSRFSTFSNSNSVAVHIGEESLPYKFTLGYEHTSQNQGALQNNVNNIFGRFSCYLRKERKLNVSLEFSNLLNLQNINNISSGLNDGIYTANSAADLPGYIVAGFSYSFN